MKTEQKIKSISEAYSMQPIHISVNPNKNIYGDDEPVEIKEELIHNPNGEYLSVYIGYNNKGRRLFRYLVNSVNVHYF